MSPLAATMAEGLIQHAGWTQERVDQALVRDAAEANALPAPVAKPTGPRSLESLMRHSLLERGLISQADADESAVREAEGIEPDAEQAPAREGLAIDPEADKLERTMASAFDPPATPAGYDLPPVANFDPTLGAAYRALAHASGMDAPLAKTIYSEFDAHAAKGEPTHGAREMYAAQSRSEVQRMFGGRFDVMLGHANTELARIANGRPGILDLVTKTDLGNNPRLIAALAARGLARSKA